MFNKIKHITITTMVVLLLSLTIFLNIDFFIDDKITARWYAFIILSCLCGLLGGLYLEPKIFIRREFILLVILVCYIGIRDVLSETQIINFSILVSVIALHLFFLIDSQKKSYELFFIGFTLIQAVYGLLQYSKILPTAGDLRVLGSYGNPSGLAANLSFTFPLLFLFFRQYRLLTGIIGLVFIITIIFSGSRAGLLALVIPCMIFFLKDLSPTLELYRKQFIRAVIFLTLLLFIYLFFLKQDSAVGRMLMWQVGGDVILENLVFGGGSYGFHKNYMIHQAEYFINNPESRYELLASNMMHPFNEYLLLVARYGLVSLIFIIYIFVSLKRNVQWASPYFLCLISIAVFSLFSYPFQYPITWVVLIFSIVNLSRGMQSVFTVSKRWFIAFFLPFICLAICFLIKDIKFEYTWNKIGTQSLAGRTEEVMPQYEKLYKDWNGNHLFLYNYAAELNHLGENKRSNEVLARTLEYWNDYDIQMLIGDNFKALYRWADAEQHFKLASKMVPNRFLPLYNLHEVYVNSNRKDDAMQIANEILSKQVKIPSATVYFIQAEMKKYIKENIK